MHYRSMFGVLVAACVVASILSIPMLLSGQHSYFEWWLVEHLAWIAILPVLFCVGVVTVVMNTFARGDDDADVSDIY